MWFERGDYKSKMPLLYGIAKAYLFTNVKETTLQPPMYNSVPELLWKGNGGTSILALLIPSFSYLSL